MSVAPRRGRPRKFSAPSRPVTLTLPVETIEALTAVDADLSRAVVRIAQSEVRHRHAAAELATFGRRAIIIVNASRALERRIGMHLVPLPDGRALISFEETTTPRLLSCGSRMRSRIPAFPAPIEKRSKPSWKS